MESTVLLVSLRTERREAWSARGKGEPVHDRELESASTKLLLAAVRVSAVSVVWTLATSTAAILVAVASNSLVVAAFGMTGLIDAVASTALLIHFRHALRREAISGRRERVALGLVRIGLFVVGAATLTESVRRLLIGVHGQPAPLGAAIAAAALLVLGFLSFRKRRIAAAIPSRALRADGWLSATGALLAAVTVAGAGLNAAFGLWWLDPVAAVGVAAGAIYAAMVLA